MVVVGNVDVPNVNFGITQPLSLGNLVWNDVNRDGQKMRQRVVLQELPFICMLMRTMMVHQTDAIANTTTNSSGLYVFNGLTPGNYIVGVVPPSPASGNPYSSSPVNETNPNSNVDNNDNGVTTTAGQTYSGTINLTPGAEPLGETPNNGTATDANSNLTLDFGFYQPVNVSGNVYVDNNGPTNVDGTGTGTAGTTQLYANLVGPNGNVVASVPVNSNGTYQFNDVAPNTTYTMVLSTTPGTVGNPAPSTTLHPVGAMYQKIAAIIPAADYKWSNYSSCW
ncbi:MAG: hypothetical protein HWD58_11970 [Bacteroidota bacterium]|nr:MAG: hypothetical protein HWD58_11970 [Bacteroidota bacterium]